MSSIDGGVHRDRPLHTADRGGSGGRFNYARAQGLSRSRPIPEGSRGDDTLPRRIDHALFELARRLECGYVLYVSGDSTRPVWPLLSNKNADLLPADDGPTNGRPALPGATLAPEHGPRAVIRTTSSADPSIPVPALFHEIGEDGNENDGDKTSNALFQFDGTDTTFLMSRRPHQMDGKTPSAKSGQNQGRWSCDDKEQQAETWYNLMATEFAVIQRPDGDDALPYALTTAAVQPRPGLGTPHPPPAAHPRRHPDGQEPPRIPAQHRLGDRRRPRLNRCTDGRNALRSSAPDQVRRRPLVTRRAAARASVLGAQRPGRVQLPQRVIGGPAGRTAGRGCASTGQRHRAPPKLPG
ncbi:DUF3893 domain-containing protein [Streptomyces sp. SID13666]|nr:RNaseH domain-containing protein [Streptomyces sp. SID13666]NEA60405.1 DUF3893 domain-containing protein [Streptomyces sp. SID13666]